MEETILNTKQGILKGKTGRDYDGNKYYGFLGIPYAKPPIGKLRFKAPQPLQKWIGIRDATQDGSPCISRDALDNIVGSEDCLFLNVFTPELPKNGIPLKPVMVWIHGGKYTSGSNNSHLYSPEYLLTQDVVVVTINYRLGVLGFLSMNDPDLKVPGNAAFKDMVMALKWVQINIKDFGGNPNNVTIFGESAGGKAVHYLVLSPMAKGLFHKAISQSGAILSPSSYAKPSANELAQALKCPHIDEKNILDYLQNLPAEKILEGQELMGDNFAPYFLRLIGPVIEKPSPHEAAFLCEEPLKLIMGGDYNHVPFIMGYNSNEGLFFEKNRIHSDTDIDFEKYIPNYFKLKLGSPLSMHIAEKIKEFYFGEETPSALNKGKLLMLQTDSVFLRGIYTSIKGHVNTSKEPLFFYKFSVDAGCNLYKILFDINFPGAAHADDLGYLFKTAITCGNVLAGSIEEKIIKTMVKLWTNFAKTGNPNSIEEIIWKPVRKDKVNYLDIGQNLTRRVNPEKERMEFWDGISNIVPLISKL